MNNSFGKNLIYTSFGESHGKGIGFVLDGLPAGIKVDFDYIENELAKRRPKKDMGTSRVEPDDYEVISGIFNGYTTGTPITVVIYNKDVNDKVYDDSKNFMRPSHADYTSHIKYKGYEDYRGGGHFSGRITVGLVFAGSICRNFLLSKNIKIETHIKEISDIKDKTFFNMSENELEKNIDYLSNEDIKVIDRNIKDKMIEKVKEIGTLGDSIGGVTESIIYGIEAGIGNPIYENIESKISYACFGIPAVKGISFGAGFDFKNMLGSIANDSFYIDEKNRVKTKTNNNAGINGGISNAMPIIFDLAIKPTPSIYKEQESIDIEKMENVKSNIKGRHDPAIIMRVPIVVTSTISLVITDLLLSKYGENII